MIPRRSSDRPAVFNFVPTFLQILPRTQFGLCHTPYGVWQSPYWVLSTKHFLENWSEIFTFKISSHAFFQNFIPWFSNMFPWFSNMFPLFSNQSQCQKLFTISRDGSRVIWKGGSICLNVKFSKPSTHADSKCIRNSTFSYKKMRLSHPDKKPPRNRVLKTLRNWVLVSELSFL